MLIYSNIYYIQNYNRNSLNIRLISKIFNGLLILIDLSKITIQSQREHKLSTTGLKYANDQL